MMPHISCAMANARLMVVMPSPVELLSGEMKSPSDCLTPIVTMRMAAAASVITHALRCLPGGMSCRHFFLTQSQSPRSVLFTRRFHALYTAQYILSRCSHDLVGERVSLGGPGEHQGTHHGG